MVFLHQLVESLVTLANLTTEERRREELYARAKLESKGYIELELDEENNEQMDVGE